MKRKLIFVAALLHCTPTMTACAEKKPQESSQPETAVTTQVDLWGAPGVQVDTTERPEDLKAATKVMNKFCNACKKSDGSDVRKYSNVEKLPEFSAVGGYTLTEEESQQSMDNKINALCAMSDYKLAEGKLNVDALRTYAEYIEDFASIGKMLRDYGDSEIVDAAEKLFKPISKIYSFDVTITTEDASNATKMYVFPDESGEWIVDTGQLQAMVDYMSVSKVKNVNALAEAAAAAVKSSLTDMDAEGLKIKDMTGEYHFDEGRLAMIDDNPVPSDLDRALAEKITVYFGEIIDLSHLYFRLDKGELTALAVQKNFRNIPYYGTWPTPVEEHFMYYFASVSDAMLYAAGEYDSPAPF